jgi:hypothetical protein
MLQQKTRIGHDADLRQNWTSLLSLTQLSICGPPSREQPASVAHQDRRLAVDWSEVRTPAAPRVVLRREHLDENIVNFGWNLPAST